jgi:hypothetical protein
MLACQPPNSPLRGDPYRGMIDLLLEIKTRHARRSEQTQTLIYLRQPGHTLRSLGVRQGHSCYPCACLDVENGT